MAWNTHRLSGWRWMLLLLCAAVPLLAGYKVRPWTPRAIDAYPAKLLSEGVTIAAEPLLNDALAAEVFDDRAIVSRTIMPLAVIVSNSNDYPVEVEASSIEVLADGRRMLPLEPDDAVLQMLKSEKKRKIGGIGLPGGIRIKFDTAETALMHDFQRKWLGLKKVEPRTTGGGFIYVPVPAGRDLQAMLAGGRIYIPRVFRPDTGAELFFFEIDLKPAVDALKSPRKR